MIIINKIAVCHFCTTLFKMLNLCILNTKITHLKCFESIISGYVFAGYSDQGK